MGVKYALLKYSTENVGDEIQSIAARRFLPRVDFYIDRDRLSEFKSNGRDEVKLIANGWFMRNPFGWPPVDKSLKPLLISMYVERRPVSSEKIRPSDIFSDPTSIDYLNQHGPVGARDLSTLEFFKSIGVNSYFSGCLTLTLNPDASIPKRDYIFAIDVPDDVLIEMRRRTNRKIIEISPYGDFALSGENRFVLAEYFLYLYQSAHAVITTRLHGTLPCIALGTPVLLINDNDKFDVNRYSGLSDLAHSCTSQEYIDGAFEFNLDNPPPNKQAYLKIRESIEKACVEYTGFDSNCSYLSRGIEEILTSDEFVDVFGDSFQKRHLYMLEKMETDYYRGEVRARDQIIQELNRSIEERENNVRSLERKLANAHNELYGLKDDYRSIRTTSLVYIIRAMRRRMGNIRRNK